MRERGLFWMRRRLRAAKVTGAKTGFGFGWEFGIEGLRGRGVGDEMDISATGSAPKGFLFVEALLLLRLGGSLAQIQIKLRHIECRGLEFGVFDRVRGFDGQKVFQVLNILGFPGHKIISLKQ